MRIQRLAANVANQIAAGEVIERPASVVKELLENSFDAGATQISIELGFGGLNLIKVSDNGHGIDAEDLHLAIAAHATSKITQLNDLYQMKTMGFRGEALASMASVSRMKIASKPAYQSHARMLALGEKGMDVQACARTNGTTIEIHDLFYNAPVRKGFLKSEKLEYQAIELVVKQFALSAPHVTLNLKHNQKQMLHLPKADCEQSRILRIKKLFGQGFLADAVYIHEVHAALTVEGWISQSQYQRSQRDRQWVYLNQRVIKDKLIHQAIGQTYQNILHPGRYPSCVLYLTMPADQVDVNVHPTKHEVRFRDPRLIHSILVSTLSSPLQPPSTDHQPAARESKKISSVPMHAPSLYSAHEQPWLVITPHMVIHQYAPNETFLINILKVHQHALQHTLETLEKPLPSRPLLVPVKINFVGSHYAWFEKNQAFFMRFGLQFDFVSETSLMIRTIPLCLPQLNFSEFFLTIQQVKPEDHRFIQQLIACQTIDAYNISSLERETLMAYCLKNLSLLHRSKACVRLDNNLCQQLFDLMSTYA